MRGVRRLAAAPQQADRIAVYYHIGDMIDLAVSIKRAAPDQRWAIQVRSCWDMMGHTRISRSPVLCL
jgi:hypothetical protein